MKKKIIRITTIPISLKTLLKGQLEYMNQYFEVIAVSSGGVDFDEFLLQEKVKGVKINFNRKISPINDFVALVQLVKLFRKEKPFIVHTHTLKAGLLGMIAAFIVRVPHRLHTVAGIYFLDMSGLKRKLFELLERTTNSCATMIYPNSFKMKEIMIMKNYSKLVNTKVIANGSSNGIDINYFKKESVAISKVDIQNNLGISNNSIVFCFVGRVRKDKGINELINAFSKLYNEDPRVRLIVVGNFEKDMDPVDEMTEYNIYNHQGIVFVGFQKDIRPYLLSSDVLVMQAGAMDLPCIVTNINGCNEIIVESVNGFIVPPKDSLSLYTSMKRCSKNPDIVTEMASNARELIVSRFERKIIWEALLKEYNSLH